MFDVGLSELFLFAIVALIVLGPERLPDAMRTLGRYYAKLKRTFTDIQSYVDQELKLMELHEQMQKELEHIKKTEQLMRHELDQMNIEMHRIRSQTVHDKIHSSTISEEDTLLNQKSSP